MAEDRQHEPKQKTPKGYEIPVPKRGDFADALAKVAKPSVAPKRRPKK